MYLSEINPHIRFAEQISYRSAGKAVIAKDCRIFYILSGRGEILIADQRYELMENSLFFCRENSIYTIISDGFSLFALDFDLTQRYANIVDAMPPVHAETTNIPEDINAETVDDCSFLNSHIYIKNGERYSEAIENIILEFKLRKLYFREKSGGILKGVLTDIARGQTLPADSSASAVSRVIDYINTNFEKSITNKQLAEMVGYHEYHLNRLFLQHTGQSLHQYLLTQRLNEAKRLLLGSDLSLSEIAERCGFNSSAHFSSYFKRITGLPPYQYRIKFKSGI